MRLSRYKMERYVYVRKGEMGGGGEREKERESLFVCFLDCLHVYLLN
jgi:hypothetical protein